MRNLKFNVGTDNIHQLPQTTGDGIHSLLQEVMWDVGDNFPNPALQLFQCVRCWGMLPGAAVAQWLRCCATNRKVAGSIPDAVTEIFL